MEFGVRQIRTARHPCDNTLNNVKPMKFSHSKRAKQQQRTKEKTQHVYTVNKSRHELLP